MPADLRNGDKSRVGVLYCQSSSCRNCKFYGSGFPGYTIVGSVESSSCSYWVFYLPMSSMDSTEEIIDSLIKEKGAQALVGVTVEHTRSAFALPLVGSECTVVKAQAVRGVN